MGFDLFGDYERGPSTVHRKSVGTYRHYNQQYLKFLQVDVVTSAGIFGLYICMHNINSGRR